MELEDKIFLAGHRGLVGSAIERLLVLRGFSNIITRTREELDLTNQPAVIDFFEAEKPKYVILAAAKVGGIHANNSYPADFIYDSDRAPICRRCLKSATKGSGGRRRT